MGERIWPRGEKEKEEEEVSTKSDEYARYVQRGGGKHFNLLPPPTRIQYMHTLCGEKSAPSVFARYDY